MSEIKLYIRPDAPVFLSEKERDLIRAALGSWTNPGVKELLLKIGRPLPPSLMERVRARRAARR